MRPRRTVSALALRAAVAGLCLTWLTGASSDAEPASGAPAASRPQAPSLAGSYLSGRFARSQHETGSAARYYEAALATDPDSNVLIEQAFLMETSEGNWQRALPLADQVANRMPTHRMARTLLGLTAFKAGEWDKAEDHLKAAGTGPIGELTYALTAAWVKLARGDASRAIAALESPRLPEWAQYYMRYHKALIADVAGRKDEARETYERVFKQDPRTLRTMLAYAYSAIASGDHKLARGIVKEHLDRTTGEGHPLARALRDELAAGDPVKTKLVTNASQGLAEVFYGLGEALTNEGESGVAVGILYLQLAINLQPDFPFALAALANAHESTKRYAAAIATYDRIPKGSPLSSTIEIRKAINLNALEKVDEAKKVLEGLAAADPNDIRPLDALGGIMRSHKRYAEAIDYYTRAINLIQKPEKRHWTFYYSRGTSYERIKKWPQAEVDLQKALQLYPDQPLVLNYLGYSWIDQNRNLKEGMKLIEKAVALKPDDGYIVDSLGWAHFRLGNFKEAVKHLERAVELRPEDPVLNDHLGDALWKVGREREARFQWEQSLSLKPEPEDAERTKKKLVHGLNPPKPQEAKAPAKKPKEATAKPELKKRAETKTEPAKSIFEQ
jgi:tetratricopeptide (TPR) repeat protein